MSDWTREQWTGPGEMHHFAATSAAGVVTYYLDGERVDREHPWFQWLRSEAPLNVVDPPEDD